MEYRAVRVVIETDRHRIAGSIWLPADGYRSRVTDILNSSERDFIPITDAKIEFFSANGEPPLHKTFLALARRHIVLAMAGDEDGD